MMKINCDSCLEQKDIEKTTHICFECVQHLKKEK